MALSNAERQRRYKQRLKERAQAGQDVEALMAQWAEERLRLETEIWALNLTAKSKLGKAGKDIAKIVPMLSSDNKEEVLNAVRAIERKLKASKLSWHDLAQSIG